MNLAVILAAGLGSRMNSISRRKPKGFIELGGKPLIERSMDSLKSIGISKIFIGTGYLSEHYEAYQDNSSLFCHKNTFFSASGSFFTLYNMRKYIDQDFFLLESDLLYERRALSVLKNNKKKDVILASGRTGAGDEVFIEVNMNNCLIDLSKNPKELSSVTGELVGVSKISLESFQMLCEWADQNKDESMHIDYEKALTKIADKRNIYIEKIEDLIWIEIDTDESYRRAVDFVYPRLLENKDES